MHWLRTSLLALCMTLSTAAVAQTAPADPATVTELVTAVETTYAGVQSIRADFVQVTHSATMAQETRQRGKVLLERPRKMRWDFQQPDSSSFVTDGATMWVWSSSSNQVIISSANAAAGAGMTQLLDDLNQIDEQFNVTLVDGANDAGKRSFVLELIPKKEASFKKLRLTIAKKKYTLEQVTLTDQFNNQVELAFSQVRMNTDIPDTEFTFQVPKGAQVIRTDGP